MPLCYQHTGRATASMAPVVALHGATMCKEAWAPVLAHLGDAEVILVDLPGHGGSVDVHAATAERMLAAVVDLLTALRVPRAVWAGHSMGGIVCQQAAAQHAVAKTELVAGLVLVATSARFKVPDGFTELPAADFERAVVMMLSISFGPDAPPAAIAAAEQSMRVAGVRGVEDAFRVCASFDGRAALANIRVPTAVLSAEHDLLAPAFIGERLAAGIEGSTFRTLSGAGHMLLAERPAEVARAILDVRARTG